jgi:hypothetical protein
MVFSIDKMVLESPLGLGFKVISSLPIEKPSNYCTFGGILDMVGILETHTYALGLLHVQPQLQPIMAVIITRAM